MLEFDRGPCDHRNILVVILSKHDAFYRIGCKEGRINTRYTASDLAPLKEKFLSVADVPDVEMSLRTAVAKYSGGQGYVKCGCKTSCKLNRCSCRNYPSCVTHAAIKVDHAKIIIF